jgi:hypothetical protein
MGVIRTHPPRHSAWLNLCFSILRTNQWRLVITTLPLKCRRKFVVHIALWYTLRTLPVNHEHVSFIPVSVE